MKFVIFKDRKREWRWRLKAKNGRIIATSSEGYKRKQGAVHSIVLVQAFSLSAILARKAAA